MNTELPVEPISTDRLSLRRFRAADYDAYATYHTDADVYRYLYSAPPDAMALKKQFAAAIDDPFVEDGDAFRLAVTRQDDGAVVGEVLLKIASTSARQGEVGYIFNPAFAGHGYATEATGAILDFGFSRIGFHRIFARLDTKNSASIGVVERLGMRREAHFIENDCFDGVWGDEYVYALLRSEWIRRGRS